LNAVVRVKNHKARRAILFGDSVEGIDDRLFNRVGLNGNEQGNGHVFLVRSARGTLYTGQKSHSGCCGEAKNPEPVKHA
jgi:hypothetical protein